MTIVKWKPSLFPTIPSRFFDDFFNVDFPELKLRNIASEGVTLPAVNVKETADDFQLEVAAPGMDKKDFNVEVVDGVLKISAQKEVSKEERDNGYTRKEFNYASFQRSFTLPESVDGNNIAAKYADGILHITLPKKPEAKPQPARVIEIG